jgi:GT2 family glycosyltransferase
MAEMVGHEVSGLLFSPGDPASLRAALERLIAEPGLLERLRRGAPPVRTLDQDAAWHDQLYAGLRAGAAARPRLAAVVLNYRTPRDTVLAVRSLASGDRAPDRVIVVDNASGGGSLEVIRRHLPAVDLVASPTNLGFSGGCNLGIRRALASGADRVLLVNGDVILARDALRRLEAAVDEPGVGLVAPVILHRSAPNRIASAGMSFHRLTGRMRHLHAEAPSASRPVPERLRVAGVMGCAMLVDASVFERVGALDDDYFFSFEDLDLCLRAEAAGLASVIVGSAAAYHAGSRSIGADSPARLYYATRNHLLLARRAAPLPAVLGLPRAATIVALNLAHALRCGWMPAGRALAACVAGLRDHLRGRTGPMPEPLS